MHRWVLSLVVLGVGSSAVACSSSGEVDPVSGSTSQQSGGAGSIAGSAAGLGGAGSGGAGLSALPGGGATQNSSGGAPAGGGNLAGSGGVSSGLGGAAPGTAGAAGAAPMALCATGAVPVGNGRCAANKTIAKGSAIMIHDFEDPGSDTPKDYLGIFFGDGRSGRWFDSHDTAAKAAVSLLAEPTNGGPSGNTHALHYRGTAPLGFGATIGVPVASCYDASAYKGVSFWMKGDPSVGNAQVKFSVATPPTEPIASGGGCTLADELAGKCYDHYAQTETISTQWVRHDIHWQDLKQNCSSGNGYKPQSEILNFSFSILDPSKGFDFWVDNFSFDTGDLPSATFAQIVPEAAFNEMWETRVAGKVINQRSAFYTYAGLLSAIDAFGKGAFAATGASDQRRREAAMFLSNIGHETDSLALVEEKACVSAACPQYGQASNGKYYDGRGAIQLSYAANYAAAGAALGVDLTNHPELVATDPKIAFGTAVWFWMNPQSGQGSPHDAVNSGLGATIRVINGIECNNGNAPAVANRIRLYHRFCNMLGVEPGTGDGC